MKLSNKTKNIAIFGSNGHIAKNLIFYFLQNSKYNLSLFSRNQEKIQSFVSNIDLNKNVNYVSYDKLDSRVFDVIINCIGISEHSELHTSENNMFDLSNNYDELIIRYLKNNPCQYLNFSSGIVYGDFTQPPTNNSISKIGNSDLIHNPYYLSKIHLENKHRSMHSLNIIDIRLFSFFSRFIDLNSSFFMSQVITAIINNEELFTDEQNFFRDFIHPADLFQLVLLCIENLKLNFAVDAYSKSPISKYDILKEFSNRYGLKYSFKNNFKTKQPTGFKKQYYSLSRTAKDIGFAPIYSSLESLLDESSFLI